MPCFFWVKGQGQTWRDGICFRFGGGLTSLGQLQLLFIRNLMKIMWKHDPNNTIVLATLHTEMCDYLVSFLWLLH